MEKARRVLRCYLAARRDGTPGANWYPERQRWCRALAKEYNRAGGNPPLGLPHVAAIVAVTSPITIWEQQLLAVPAFVLGKKGIRPGFKGNWKKAEAILRGAPIKNHLKGPKVQAFYRNIMGYADTVTVDRHAARLALGHVPLRWDASGKPIWPDLPKLEGAAYESIVDAYRMAAAAVTEKPTAVQAVTWTWWRNKYWR